VVLKTYRQKRNFKRTPEPSELERKTSKFSEKSIFVVHEHWATHHHFDFRLQIDGVLKSWAIPKKPPTFEIKNWLLLKSKLS